MRLGKGSGAVRTHAKLEVAVSEEVFQKLCKSCLPVVTRADILDFVSLVAGFLFGMKKLSVWSASLLKDSMASFWAELEVTNKASSLTFFSVSPRPIAQPEEMTLPAAKQ
jgi:hypothetical protein